MDHERRLVPAHGYDGKTNRTPLHSTTVLTFDRKDMAAGAKPRLAFPNPNAAAMFLEAAQCAMPHECGWYLTGVENGEPRGPTDQEEHIMNRFRFRAR